MNERIPKIKKIPLSGNLQSVDISNRDVQHLLRDVNKACLDTDFSQQWTAVKVALVHNSDLEASYKKKKCELKECRTAQSLKENLGFLQITTCQKEKIVREGLQVHSQSFNKLGKGDCGVCLNRFFDVELKFSWQFGTNLKDIFVFKFISGKCKSIRLDNVYSKSECLDPTPNYDSHISYTQPTTSDHLFVQRVRSGIYLYEYTEDCEPSNCPRQCLPFAVISCIMVDKPVKPVASLFSGNKSISGENQNAHEKSKSENEKTISSTKTVRKRVSFAESPSTSEVISVSAEPHDITPVNWKKLQHASKEVLSPERERKLNVVIGKQGDYLQRLANAQKALQEEKDAMFSGLSEILPDQIFSQPEDSSSNTISLVKKDNNGKHLSWSNSALKTQSKQQRKYKLSTPLLSRLKTHRHLQTPKHGPTIPKQITSKPIQTVEQELVVHQFESDLASAFLGNSIRRHCKNSKISSLQSRKTSAGLSKPGDKFGNECETKTKSIGSGHIKKIGKGICKSKLKSKLPHFPIESIKQAIKSVSTSRQIASESQKESESSSEDVLILNGTKSSDDCAGKNDCSSIDGKDRDAQSSPTKSGKTCSNLNLGKTESNRKPEKRDSQQNIEMIHSNQQTGMLYSNQKTENFQTNQKTENIQSSKKTENILSHQKTENIKSNHKIENNQSSKKAENIQSHQKTDNVPSRQKTDNVPSKQKTDNVPSRQKTDNVPSSHRLERKDSNQQTEMIHSNQKTENIHSNHKTENIQSNNKKAETIQSHQKTENIQSSQRLERRDSNQQTGVIRSNQETENQIPERRDSTQKTGMIHSNQKLIRRDSNQKTGGIYSNQKTGNIQSNQRLKRQDSNQQTGIAHSNQITKNVQSNQRLERRDSNQKTGMIHSYQKTENVQSSQRLERRDSNQKTGMAHSYQKTENVSLNQKHEKTTMIQKLEKLNSNQMFEKMDSNQKPGKTDSIQETDITSSNQKPERSNLKPENIDSSSSQKPEKNNSSKTYGKTNSSEKPSTTNSSQKSEQTNSSGKSEKSNSSQKPETANSSQKSEQTNSSHKSEKVHPSQKPKITNSSQKSEKANSSQKPEATNSSQKPEATNSRQKSEQTNLSQKSEKANSSHKSEKIHAIHWLEKSISKQVVQKTHRKPDKIESTQKPPKTDWNQKTDKVKQQKHDLVWDSMSKLSSPNNANNFSKEHHSSGQKSTVIQSASSTSTKAENTFIHKNIKNSKSSNLLPLPIINKDGSVSTVLRGIVDGMIKQVCFPRKSFENIDLGTWRKPSFSKQPKDEPQENVSQETDVITPKVSLEKGTLKKDAGLAKILNNTECPPDKSRNIISGAVDSNVRVKRLEKRAKILEITDETMQEIKDISGNTYVSSGSLSTFPCKTKSRKKSPSTSRKIPKASSEEVKVSAYPMSLFQSTAMTQRKQSPSISWLSPGDLYESSEVSDSATSSLQTSANISVGKPEISNEDSLNGVEVFDHQPPTDAENYTQSPLTSSSSESEVTIKHTSLQIESPSDEASNESRGYTRSISMLDLGITCYLSALSDLHYQPSVSLIDCCEIVKSSEEFPNCKNCSKERNSNVLSAMRKIQETSDKGIDQEDVSDHDENGYGSEHDSDTESTHPLHMYLSQAAAADASYENLSPPYHLQIDLSPTSSPEASSKTQKKWKESRNHFQVCDNTGESRSEMVPLCTDGRDEKGVRDLIDFSEHDENGHENEHDSDIESTSPLHIDLSLTPTPDGSYESLSSPYHLQIDLSPVSSPEASSETEKETELTNDFHLCGKSGLIRSAVAPQCTDGGDEKVMRDRQFNIGSNLGLDSQSLNHHQLNSWLSADSTHSPVASSSCQVQAFSNCDEISTLVEKENVPIELGTSQSGSTKENVSGRHSGILPADGDLPADSQSTCDVKDNRNERRTNNFSKVPIDINNDKKPDAVESSTSEGFGKEFVQVQDHKTIEDDLQVWDFEDNGIGTGHTSVNKEYSQNATRNASDNTVKERDFGVGHRDLSKNLLRIYENLGGTISSVNASLKCVKNLHLEIGEMGPKRGSNMTKNQHLKIGEMGPKRDPGYDKISNMGPKTDGHIAKILENDKLSDTRPKINGSMNKCLGGDKIGNTVVKREVDMNKCLGGDKIGNTVVKREVDMNKCLGGDKIGNTVVKREVDMNECLGDDKIGDTGPNRQGNMSEHPGDGKIGYTGHEGEGNVTKIVGADNIGDMVPKRGSNMTKSLGAGKIIDTGPKRDGDLSKLLGADKIGATGPKRDINVNNCLGDDKIGDTVPRRDGNTTKSLRIDKTSDAGPKRDGSMTTHPGADNIGDMVPKTVGSMTTGLGRGKIVGARPKRDGNLPKRFGDDKIGGVESKGDGNMTKRPGNYKTDDTGPTRGDDMSTVLKDDKIGDKVPKRDCKMTKHHGSDKIRDLVLKTDVITTKSLSADKNGDIVAKRDGNMTKSIGTDKIGDIVAKRDGNMTKSIGTDKSGDIVAKRDGNITKSIGTDKIGDIVAKRDGNMTKSIGTDKIGDIVAKRDGNMTKSIGTDKSGDIVAKRDGNITKSIGTDKIGDIVAKRDGNMTKSIGTDKSGDIVAKRDGNMTKSIGTDKSGDIVAKRDGNITKSIGTDEIGDIVAKRDGNMTKSIGTDKSGDIVAKRDGNITKSIGTDEIGDIVAKRDGNMTKSIGTDKIGDIVAKRDGNMTKSIGTDKSGDIVAKRDGNITKSIGTDKIGDIVAKRDGNMTKSIGTDKIGDIVAKRDGNMTKSIRTDKSGDIVAKRDGDMTKSIGTDKIGDIVAKRDGNMTKSFGADQINDTKPKKEGNGTKTIGADTIGDAEPKTDCNRAKSLGADRIDDTGLRKNSNMNKSFEADNIGDTGPKRDGNMNKSFGTDKIGAIRHRRDSNMIKSFGTDKIGDTGHTRDGIGAKILGTSKIGDTGPKRDSYLTKSFGANKIADTRPKSDSYMTKNLEGDKIGDMGPKRDGKMTKRHGDDNLSDTGPIKEDNVNRILGAGKIGDAGPKRDDNVTKSLGDDEIGDTAPKRDSNMTKSLGNDKIVDTGPKRDSNMTKCLGNDKIVDTGPKRDSNMTKSLGNDKIVDTGLKRDSNMTKSLGDNEIVDAGLKRGSSTTKSLGNDKIVDTGPQKDSDMTKSLGNDKIVDTGPQKDSDMTKSLGNDKIVDTGPQKDSDMTKSLGNDKIVDTGPQKDSDMTKSLGNDKIVDAGPPKNSDMTKSLGNDKIVDTGPQKDSDMTKSLGNNKIVDTGPQKDSDMTKSLGNNKIGDTGPPKDSDMTKSVGNDRTVNTGPKKDSNMTKSHGNDKIVDTGLKKDSKITKSLGDNKIVDVRPERDGEMTKSLGDDNVVDVRPKRDNRMNKNVGDHVGMKTEGNKSNNCSNAKVNRQTSRWDEKERPKKCSGNIFENVESIWGKYAQSNTQNKKDFTVNSSASSDKMCSGNREKRAAKCLDETGHVIERKNIDSNRKSILIQRVERVMETVRIEGKEGDQVGSCEKLLKEKNDANISSGSLALEKDDSVTVTTETLALERKQPFSSDFGSGEKQVSDITAHKKLKLSSDKPEKLLDRQACLTPRLVPNCPVNDHYTSTPSESSKQEKDFMKGGSKVFLKAASKKEIWMNFRKSLKSSSALSSANLQSTNIIPTSSLDSCSVLSESCPEEASSFCNVKSSQEPQSSINSVSTADNFDITSSSNSAIIESSTYALSSRSSYRPADSSPAFLSTIQDFGDVDYRQLTSANTKNSYFQNTPCNPQEADTNAFGKICENGDVDYRYSATPTPVSKQVHVESKRDIGDASYSDHVLSFITTSSLPSTDATNSSATKEKADTFPRDGSKRPKTTADSLSEGLTAWRENSSVIHSTEDSRKDHEVEGNTKALSTSCLPLTPTICKGLIPGLDVDLLSCSEVSESHSKTNSSRSEKDSAVEGPPSKVDENDLETVLKGLLPKTVTNYIDLNQRKCKEILNQFASNIKESSRDTLSQAQDVRDSESNEYDSRSSLAQMAQTKTPKEKQHNVIGSDALRYEACNLTPESSQEKNIFTLCKEAIEMVKKQDAAKPVETSNDSGEGDDFQRNAHTGEKSLASEWLYVDHLNQLEGQRDEGNSKVSKCFLVDSHSSASVSTSSFHRCISDPDSTNKGENAYHRKAPNAPLSTVYETDSPYLSQSTSREDDNFFWRCANSGHRTNEQKRDSLPQDNHSVIFKQTSKEYEESYDNESKLRSPCTPSFVSKRDASPAAEYFTSDYVPDAASESEVKVCPPSPNQNDPLPSTASSSVTELPSFDRGYYDDNCVSGRRKRPVHLLHSLSAVEESKDFATKEKRTASKICPERSLSCPSVKDNLSITFMRGHVSPPKSPSLEREITNVCGKNQFDQTSFCSSSHAAVTAKELKSSYNSLEGLGKCIGEKLSPDRNTFGTSAPSDKMFDTNQNASSVKRNIDVLSTPSNDPAIHSQVSDHQDYEKFELDKRSSEFKETDTIPEDAEKASEELLPAKETEIAFSRAATPSESSSTGKGKILLSQVPMEALSIARHFILDQLNLLTEEMPEPDDSQQEPHEDAEDGEQDDGEEEEDVVHKSPFSEVSSDGSIEVSAGLSSERKQILERKSGQQHCMPRGAMLANDIREKIIVTVSSQSEGECTPIVKGKLWDRSVHRYKIEEGTIIIGSNSEDERSTILDKGEVDRHKSPESENPDEKISIRREEYPATHRRIVGVPSQSATALCKYVIPKSSAVRIDRGLSPDSISSSPIAQHDFSHKKPEGSSSLSYGRISIDSSSSEEEQDQRYIGHKAHDSKGRISSRGYTSCDRSQSKEYHLDNQRHQSSPRNKKRYDEKERGFHRDYRSSYRIHNSSSADSKNKGQRSSFRSFTSNTKRRRSWSRDDSLDPSCRSSKDSLDRGQRSSSRNYCGNPKRRRSSSRENSRDNRRQRSWSGDISSTDSSSRSSSRNKYSRARRQRSSSSEYSRVDKIQRSLSRDYDSCDKRQGSASRDFRTHDGRISLNSPSEDDHRFKGIPSPLHSVVQRDLSRLLSPFHLHRDRTRKSPSFDSGDKARCDRSSLSPGRRYKERRGRNSSPPPRHDYCDRREKSRSRSQSPSSRDRHTLEPRFKGSPSWSGYYQSRRAKISPSPDRRQGTGRRRGSSSPDRDHQGARGRSPISPPHRKRNKRDGNSTSPNHSDCDGRSETSLNSDQEYIQRVHNFIKRSRRSPNPSTLASSSSLSTYEKVSRYRERR